MPPSSSEKPRLRLQDVQRGRRLDRPLQIRRRGRRNAVGQRQQDAPDLFRFLLLERDDVVVDFDGAERLEKQARAARRSCRGRCPGIAVRFSARTTST